MAESVGPVNGAPDGARLLLTNLNTGRTHPFAQFPAPGSPPSPYPDYASGLVAFSPDSRAIAFGFLSRVPNKGAAVGVVFMSVATGHTIRSITVPGVNTGPPFLWLPNGRLLFQVGVTGLATVSKTGTGLRPININLPAGFDAEINEVAASPDGSQLAIEMVAGQGCSEDSTPCTSTLYVAPTAGGTARRLAPSSESVPVWSPDSKYLVDQAGAIKLITVATGHTITIRPPRLRASLVGWRPVTGPRDASLRRRDSPIASASDSTQWHCSRAAGLLLGGSCIGVRPCILDASRRRPSLTRKAEAGGTPMASLWCCKYGSRWW